MKLPKYPSVLKFVKLFRMGYYIVQPFLTWIHLVWAIIDTDPSRFSGGVIHEPMSQPKIDLWPISLPWLDLQRVSLSWLLYCGSFEVQWRCWWPERAALFYAMEMSRQWFPSWFSSNLCLLVPPSGCILFLLWWLYVFFDLGFVTTDLLLYQICTVDSCVLCCLWLSCRGFQCLLVSLK